MNFIEKISARNFLQENFFKTLEFTARSWWKSKLITYAGLMARTLLRHAHTWINIWIHFSVFDQIRAGIIGGHRSTAMHFGHFRWHFSVLHTDLSMILRVLRRSYPISGTEGAPRLVWVTICTRPSLYSYRINSLDQWYWFNTVAPIA